MSSKNNKTSSTQTRSSTKNRTPASRAGNVRTKRVANMARDAQDSEDVVTPMPASPRKPLGRRDNAVVPNTNATKPSMTPKPKFKASKKADDLVGVEREPIKAFLRIRPQSSDEEPNTPPYLTALSETSVRMIDPSPMSTIRPVSVQSTYTFSKVFPSMTKQSDFFTNVALPLVRDVLEGQNGLLFAYGVTNSGKTYTIQGGRGKGGAGLLPRTLDVVFNSVDGLHSNAPIRPVRLAGVEYDGEGPASVPSDFAPLEGSQNPFDLPVDDDQSVLANMIAEQIDSDDRDETVLKIDRNYEYSVWVSYAEIYNEKIFDLLGSTSSDSGSPNMPRSISTSTLPRSRSTIERFASCANLAILASVPSSSDPNNPLFVKRKALALKSDPDGGKYIAGIREVRVRTAEEAKAIVKLGQVNRRVFGTLANSASSRSHGIFTLKIMRVHKGSPNDIGTIQTARLSIVDLAGSERASNTHSTGERLKEAGNINKSLMVLGQCMEALRTNQKKLAAAPPWSNDIKLGLVPFRHSKLTELFQDFFVGDGKAVMIVNVNPYDTGFDENLHVMKFSALAKDVSTTSVKRAIPSSIPRLAPNTNYRKVTISTGGKSGTRSTETHLDVLEEDEVVEDDDSEPDDPLVRALFEKIDDLHLRLYESEMRGALIESETREEVMKEMEERMMRMERMYMKRLMNELEENQLKTDRKIDLLHQAGLIGTARKQPEKKPEDLVDDMSSTADSSVDEIALGFSPSSSGADDSPLAGKRLFSKQYSLQDNVRDTIGLFDASTDTDNELDMKN